jgi:hypothetical protein
MSYSGDDEISIEHQSFTMDALPFPPLIHTKVDPMFMNVTHSSFGTFLAVSPPYDIISSPVPFNCDSSKTKNLRPILISEDRIDESTKDNDDDNDNDNDDKDDDKDDDYIPENTDHASKQEKRARQIRFRKSRRPSSIERDPDAVLEGEGEPEDYSCFNPFRSLSLKDIDEFVQAPTSEIEQKHKSHPLFHPSDFQMDQISLTRFSYKSALTRVESASKELEIHRIASRGLRAKDRKIGRNRIASKGSRALKMSRSFLFQSAVKSLLHHMSNSQDRTDIFMEKHIHIIKLIQSVTEFCE